MASITWLLSACSSPDEVTGHLRLIEPTPQWQGEVLGLQAGLDFDPGPRLLEALNHGVVLHLRVVVEVSRSWELLVPDDRIRNHRFEIRYLPLVRHYELTDLKTGQQRSFPRLSMVLENLAQPQWLDTRMSLEDIVQPGWQMRARADIDRTRLPSPMRLPVWFDRHWRLAEPWQRWSLEPPEQAGHG